MMSRIFFLIMAVTVVQGGILQKPKPKPIPEPIARDNNWRNFVHRSRARAGKHLKAKVFQESSKLHVTQVVHVTIVIFTFILFRRRLANF